MPPPRVMHLNETAKYAVRTDPLQRLLDPAQPFVREDVLWALDLVKRKAADGAPEWSGLDQPRLLACFACYAEMALLLLHRRTPDQPETDCFREMLEELLCRPRSGS
ncbi:hypothetical protein E5161_05230 [Cohnella pontilimi]|uniref:Uncharacterized protein n=1 Tax=Cohnella pontilimi TaxID=2564100 RepID=A0A4U0FEQ2_9BACL|nr:hypothetical protein [Cohnella pontilimi]TJY43301.1 hypothetical protein E5161_05230 [Cohnella pontilimi]